MSNVIAFPTPEIRAHTAIERALNLIDGIDAIEFMMRLALQSPHQTVVARASQWLKDSYNVEVGPAFA